MTDFSPGQNRRVGSKEAVLAEQKGFIRFLPSLFVISLLIPVLIPAGSVQLMPHRVFLMLTFFPLLRGLFSGWAGPVLKLDYVLIFSVIWASISLGISEGTGAFEGASAIEGIGLYWVEFFGAYLVGRVCVRSTSDFVRFTKLYALIVLILLPFAVFEAVTHKPIFLDLFPNSINPIYTRDRWGLRRAQTAFAHPILFGVFVSSAFGLFWYVLRPAVLQVTGILASTIGTVLSLSTGALISLTMQSVFIIWELVTGKLPWRWRLFAALSLAAYIIVDMISNRSPFHVLVTYASFNTGSAYARIQIWEWGTDNVRNHPWFGLGLDIGNWERPTWKSASADNFWLLTAMTYGLPSLIAYVTAVYLIVRKVARVTFTDPLARRCQAGFLTAAGGIIIAGGTVHYWHAMLAFVMFFFGTGVWMINGEAEPPDSTDTDAEPAQVPQSSRYTRFPSAPKTRNNGPVDAALSQQDPDVAVSRSLSTATSKDRLRR